MTTTWWAAVRAQLDPIEARIRELCDSADSDEESFTYEDREELERLRVERRSILDGGDPPTADEGLELEAATVADKLGPIGPKTESQARALASVARQQLEASLEEGRRESAAQEKPYDPDPGRVEQHRAAVAERGWQYCAALARHEAGHLLVGLREERRGGARVRGARFVYGPDGGIVNGATDFDGSPTAVTWAAGASAAAVLGVYGHRAERLSPGDSAALARMGLGDRRAQARLMEGAVRMLQPHAGALRQIADELFAKGSISRATAAEILTTGRPPRPSLGAPAPFTFDDLARPDWLTGNPW